MEKTWRWFGKKDKITLAMLQQIGVEGVVTALHEVPNGETMAVVMVAGNQAIIPDGMFSGVRTLTSNIVLEMGYATDLHREALIATAVVLFVFILMINLCFAVLKSKEER